MSLDHLLMYIAKIICEASLPLFLTWVNLIIVCLLLFPNGIYLFSSAWFVTGRRDNTLVDGSCWATCKCNILRPTSCTEISLWKRPISTAMPGKLFSSYVLIRQRCSRDSTTSELNCFYESMKHYVLHHYHQFWEGSYICIGLLQKKSGSWGYGISRVIEETARGFSRGLIKSHVEFPGVVKK